MRVKSPFLSNGIDPNANTESTNVTGNRKISFAIVTNNKGPFLQHTLSMYLLYVNTSKDLGLEMVQGTRIPWNAGEVNKLGLSGLKNLFGFAPWTHVYLGIHIEFIYKIILS